MYTKKAIDFYTRNPISKETYTRANNISTLFTGIVRTKVAKGASILTTKQQNLLDKMNDFMNITTDDIVNPVDGGGIKKLNYNL
ncbi:hypothetical protein IUY40_16700 [Flavobacterium sp. ALJ2]|uniref:hypothetical protein n=1 Tax=Flavobacterium sp. ALJ2 TaxID=2786960 RepID=UPI00189F198B|nr:hypothetical protein [Flavobacterium sp. ALJ2]MBF7093173.1 hypothetical protein [Flavobacterium sp. ALJ2]